MAHGTILVGSAGWSIGSRQQGFDGPGTHLQRYARVLGCAEINSSFYRPHRYETYERWAGSVPDDFRFSVKLPKSITHEKRLTDALPELEAFLGQAAGLGEKLGALLMQLPPSLVFDSEKVATFLDHVRRLSATQLVCELRHASWLGEEPEALLRQYSVARVAADPAKPKGTGEPGGWPGLAYFRFHGSPRVYYSDYGPRLCEIAQRLRAISATTITAWCIFDNTASNYALLNAANLQKIILSFK